MGMSTSIIGIKPPDEKFKKMLLIWNACNDSNIKIPDEVYKYFEGYNPDEKGVQVDIENIADEYNDHDSIWYDVDLTKLSPDIKIIRFMNSW